MFNWFLPGIDQPNCPGGFVREAKSLHLCHPDVYLILANQGRRSCKGPTKVKDFFCIELHQSNLYLLTIHITFWFIGDMPGLWSYSNWCQRRGWVDQVGGWLCAIAVETFATVTIKVDKQRCPSRCVLIADDSGTHGFQNPKFQWHILTPAVHHQTRWEAN